MGKATRRGIRALGRGNGTALPGLVTLTVDPRALAGLIAEIPRGAVIVTGSNGKGTTCRMLAQVMRDAGLHPVLNSEGSNQRSGLATTMVARAGYAGHLPADPQAIGLFEVDEGSFPQILSQVSRPDAIVFTNIFRDQLDRYFEPAYIKALLERAMRQLPADTTLVLNADDPRVACLAPELKNPRLYYGISDAGMRREEPDPTSDFPRCPRCDGELAYTCVFYAHLGHWSCPACGLSRPEPQVSLSKIELTGPSSTRLQVVTPAADTVLDVPMPGLYNAYNALAAVAGAAHCQLPDQSFAAIEKVTAGSFRMERVHVAGHDVYLALAKNANGYTEVLRAVLCDGEPRRMLLGLNDCPGKQPDTSWIWDVDFDGLTGLVPAPVVTGNRAADLAVRLKYAGWLSDNQQPPVLAEPDPVRALQAALDRTPPGQPLWIVSTSIVLLQIRRWMRQQGYVQDVWRDHQEQAPARPGRAGPGPARQVRRLPVLRKPALAEPVLSEPVVSGPALTEPVLTDTVLTEAVLTETVLTEAVLTDTVLTEAVLTDTVPADTVLTEPVLAEPSVLAPERTEAPPAVQALAPDPALTETSMNEAAVLSAPVRDKNKNKKARRRSARSGAAR